ncbi:MAG: hypothetical protein EOO50_15820 [Flavobacterium sp.]|uniref:M48 family metallopeptidase n=1 Tax=Flavobacterium sp. TaxID=239 RepID=UPI00120779AE|nr:M48 family metallopeptidase [Flavobacterium sp.]RZJ64365.1 MAG: hypothetical protein EOO50_15820 [Flavobacterium sp.]
MKLRNIVVVGLLLVGSIAHAQKEISKTVKDMEGFVHSIPPNQPDGDKAIRVNVFTETGLQNVPLLIDSKTQLLKKKKPFPFDQLRPGMSFTLEAENFDISGYYQATKLVVNDIEGKSDGVDDGRLDLLTTDYAYIDGNRVKMATGKKMSGKKNTGYEGKTKENFTELIEGDFADVKGTYENGVINASKFEFYPQTKTEFAIDETDDFEHKELLKVWFDASKRKRVFGMAIEGVGYIVDDAALQEYIQKLGTSLVPSQLKAKMQFIFVVVDNPIPNAMVRPNGLSYINAGLIAEVRNEAQLAGVLAHEIAHALYEHGFTAVNDAKRREKISGLFKWSSERVKKIAENNNDKVLTSDKKGNKVAGGKILNEGLDIAFNQMPEGYFTLRMSIYDKKQELQADRVGLALAANAGYDPMEIAYFWAMQYNTYGVEPKGKDWFALGQKAIEMGEQEKSRTKVDAKTDAMKAGNTVNAVGRVLNDSWSSFKGDTHPEDKKRFEELNRLIEMYWSDPEFLASAKHQTDTFKARQKELPTALVRTAKSSAATSGKSLNNKGSKKKGS